MREQRVTAMVYMLLGILIISQSVYIPSQTDVNPINEPMVSSATSISNINAAHITEPVSLPVVQKYKADILPEPKKANACHPSPIAYLFRFVPKVTESFGFLKVRKYQSNYLS